MQQMHIQGVRSLKEVIEDAKVNNVRYVTGGLNSHDKITVKLMKQTIFKDVFTQHFLSVEVFTSDKKI